MAGDPYAAHLERARALFGQGEVLQAGQIWQAILKKQADHAEARAGLLQVKRWMDARKPVEAPAAPPPAVATAEPPTVATPEPPAAEPAPLPLAERLASPTTRVHKSTVPYKPFKPTEAEPSVIEEPPEPEPEPPPPASYASDELEPVERLLKEGCTLYDMGQADDALLKWEQILVQDPQHALALAYIAQARRELGYELSEIPVIASQAYPTPVAAAPVEPEEMIRRASQLYEMGSLEEAISSLEKILEVDPHHADAQRFLLLARRELAESTPPVHAPPAPVYATPAVPQPLPQVPAAPPPMPVYAAPTVHQSVPPPVVEPPPKVPEPPAPSRTGGTTPQSSRAGADTLEQKLSQGERLLLLGRLEEATFAFQMALSLAPDDLRAREGLQRAAEGSRTVVLPPAEATLSGMAPKPVLPPASVTTPAPASRQGPELPRTLQDLSQHPVLGSTKFLVGGAVLVVVLGVGLQLLQKQRKDEQLRVAVANARQTAVAPLSLTGQTIDLAESAAALRQEADSVLALDPVRAYHRAKELLRRDSADPVAAVLQEKAKAALLADPVPGVSLTEFQRLLGAGDLEGAERAVDALLRARPEDPDLMQRAARLERVLAGLHASKGEWNEAKTALQKGRALFPGDKSWQARLHLLERIQTMPKAEHVNWLPFLG